MWPVYCTDSLKVQAHTMWSLNHALWMKHCRYEVWDVWYRWVMNTVFLKTMFKTLFFFFPMAPTGAYMHVVSVIMLCKTHWTGPDCKEKLKTIRPNILWDKGALMRLPCTLSNCILKACDDGASTISLGRLLQGWIVPTTRSSCSQLKSIWYHQWSFSKCLNIGV